MQFKNIKINFVLCRHIIIEENNQQMEMLKDFKFVVACTVAHTYRYKS